MDERLKQKCDLIIANRAIFKKKMFWDTESNACAIMAAMMTASKDIDADAEKYTECKKILKKTVSIFSEFRGIADTMVITKMTMQEDPKAYIDGAIEVYKMLKKVFILSASPYLVMTAINIYEMGGVEKAQENIEKLDELYKKLKKEHPLLVWGNDRAYLSMLISFNLDIDKTVMEISDCYEACKKLSFDKDAVHSLAQILALSSMTAMEKSEEVEAILKGLKENKKPFSKTMGFSSLGALTLMKQSVDEKVEAICEVDEYLKNQKGFKWYDGIKIRRVYAALIVFLTYAGGENAELASNISSNLAIALIEELIMLMIISSTAANAARSSSSSSN